MISHMFLVEHAMLCDYLLRFWYQSFPCKHPNHRCIITLVIDIALVRIAGCPTPNALLRIERSPTPNALLRTNVPYFI